MLPLLRMSLHGAVMLLITMHSLNASVVLMDSNILDAEVIPPTAQLAGITRMLWAPDSSGRLFIAQKAGQIRIVKNGAVNVAPFATLSPITTNQEGGLLGLAFDPGFQVNHFVYVMYQTTMTVQRILRYDASTDIGSNPTVIVDNLPSGNGERQGGSIAFGPDGNLYWSIGNLGDGTVNGGEGLDLLYLSSKISRAHPDGTTIPSNPFYDGSGQARDYIFARGFTSPFMTLFQPATGNLLVCDVGDFYEQFFFTAAGDYAGGNTSENRQTAGMISPIIAYHKLGLGEDAVSVASASRSGSITTITTAVPHWQHAGGQITLSGMPDPSFNAAALVIKEVTSPTSLTVAQAGPDLPAETSASGLITVTSFGNCTTGAAFWDSSSVPASYRGNLIYGDYISGNIVRAIFDGSNLVSSIQLFASGSTGHVALAQGPDGALYYAGYATLGTIRRLSYISTTPSLAISPMHLAFQQGSTALIQVALTAQPANPITVHAAIAGNPGISLVGDGTLTFTPANFALPQAVSVVADLTIAPLATAVVTFTGSGATGVESVAVSASHNAQGLILSSHAVTMTEGTSTTVSVQCVSAPAGPMVVAATTSLGSSPFISVSPGTITFTASTFSTPQVVTVTAASDPAHITDTATITLTASGIAAATATVTATYPAVPGTIAITSTPVTAAVVGVSYGYQVVASASHALTFLLTTMPTGMTIDAASGMISWTPTLTGSASVVVVAHDGVDTDATQSFQVSVAPDPGTSPSTDAASHRHCGSGLFAGISLIIMSFISRRRWISTRPT